MVARVRFHWIVEHGGCLWVQLHISVLCLRYSSYRLLIPASRLLLIETTIPTVSTVHSTRIVLLTSALKEYM